MPSQLLSNKDVMKRLRIGAETLKSLARARGGQKEKLGNREYWREADIVAYENYLRYPSPKPEPQQKPIQFGRRRGAGSRTWNK